MTLRQATKADVKAIGVIAEGAELFPAEYVPEMIAPWLAAGADYWLVTDEENTVTGFAFARAEEMADRVWNILALGVDKTARGAGLGGALLAQMERDLDARMILIDTTQTEAQTAARALYVANGYAHIATIPDYYAPGDDKLTFRKVLM